MAKKSRPYTPEQWARLSPQFRRAHNKLRVARGEPPIPEPKIDQYVPPRGSIRPIDPANPEAEAAVCDFMGRGDQTSDLERIAKNLALELARKRLADRQLRTEVLHRVIAQFVALATKESGWARKRIIAEAMHIYGVKERTVEAAIADYPKRLRFTRRARVTAAK